MRPVLKIFVAFCLVSFVFSMPRPQEEEAEEGGEDESEAEGEEEAPSDAGDEESEDHAGGHNGGESEGGGVKNDPAETYNKVTALVAKATDMGKVDDEYFKSYLDGSVQEHVRNPVIEAIAKVGDFSKIESCFSSFDQDVQKVVEEKSKAFAECKGKEDGKEFECSKEHSDAAGSSFDGVTSKIKECVSSKGA